MVRPSEPSVINVTSVSLNPSTVSVEEGSTAQLTSVVLPIDATDKAVSYSSSDDLIATVDSSGLVTGVAEGSADITVTTNDGSFTDVSTVTVTV